jgi:hypothetical protein
MFLVFSVPYFVRKCNLFLFPLSVFDGFRHPLCAILSTRNYPKGLTPMNTELMMQNLAKGDPDAFQQFYNRYSLPIYHYIMARTGDPERARKVWHDTFRGLLPMLRCSDPPDLPFLLLTALADRQLDAAVPADAAADTPSAASDAPSPVSGGTSSGPDQSVSTPAPDGTAASAAGAPAPGHAPSASSGAAASVDRPGRRTGLVILLLILILMGIFALWTATGYLMALDVLPAYDLGYSWFNRVFFRLFPSSFP